MNITNKDAIKKWSQVPLGYIENYGDEGDLSKKYLLNPSLFKALGDIQGKRILEVGSGQGYLCRLLTQKGAKVTGLEPSESMITYARDRENEERLGIVYIQEDLGRFSKIDEEFDVVLANMVFLDIPDYEISMKNCIKALKKGGQFVFSLAHPCFFPSADWEKEAMVCIKEYFQEYSEEGTYGTSFHRTLSSYLNLIIKYGCVLREVVEPRLDEDIAKEYPQLERDVHVPSFIVINAIKAGI